MKKVLFYINAIHEGGAERVMVNLSADFANAGYDVILVTSFFDQWEYPVSPDVKRISLEDEENHTNVFIRNASRILKLRKVLKKEKPDVAISFMAEPNFRMLIATTGLPVKRIISVRNDPNVEYSGKIGWCVGKILLPFADGCVFQTKDAQEWFPQRLQKKSKVIFNAIHEKFFNQVYQPATGVVVTCARLEKQKNLPLLIQSFSTIENGNDAQLYIYGDGSLREELQQLIEDKGMQSRIKLMGKCDDVPTVLSKANIFVLSSDYEGLPNALMEALAVGIPCIATDCPCGGPRMLIDNELNGILIPTNDADKMSSAISKLLMDSDLCMELGMHAKEKAQIFRPEIVTREWMKYVEETCSQ